MRWRNMRPEPLTKFSLVENWISVFQGRFVKIGPAMWTASTQISTYLYRSPSILVGHRDPLKSKVDGRVAPLNHSPRTLTHVIPTSRPWNISRDIKAVTQSSQGATVENHCCSLSYLYATPKMS